VRGTLNVSLRAVAAQRLVKLADGSGRTAALELLFNDTAVAHLIREGKSHQIDSYLAQQEARADGISLDGSLLQLVRSGRVDAEEAIRRARYPGHLRQQLRDLDAARKS